MNPVGLVCYYCSEMHGLTILVRAIGCDGKDESFVQGEYARLECLTGLSSVYYSIPISRGKSGNQGGRGGAEEGCHLTNGGRAWGGGSEMVYFGAFL